MAGIPDDAKRLLTEEPQVAFLGTSHNAHPHVAPLWYVVNGDVIEIATTGRKLENLQSNARVAISVQEDTDGHPEWGVTLQGTARTIPDDAGGRDVIRRINRRYGEDEDAWSENTAVRISPGTVSHWMYD